MRITRVQQDAIPTYEWIAPTNVEMLEYFETWDKTKLTEMQWDFIADDGLLLRKIV